MQLPVRALRRALTYRLMFRRPGRDLPPPRVALCRALDWLMESHAAARERGFASHFSLADGWGPPYPETSGYIVPTLLLSRALDYRGAELQAAADATGRWLLAIQLRSGAFDAPATAQPMVFDTGQVLFGLLALTDEDQDGRFLEAARRAGEWIVAQQDPQGYWMRASYRGIPHTYYARVSWALLLLAVRTGRECFRDAARRQLCWARSRQAADGWFSDCSFFPDEKPVLHVIAYTIRGLWESALLLEDSEMEAAAVGAAEALCGIEGGRGFLESHFGPGWTPVGKSACLTGLCQIAGIWLRMGRRYGREDFTRAGRRCLSFVRRRQVLGSGRREVEGGVPGSFPLWGSYFPWAFPNWGVKFFVDGLLVLEGLDENGPIPG